LKAFVRAVEIWVPDVRGQVLVLSSAYYGDLEEFESASAGMSFEYDEGLPGKTWAAGGPIVLTDFDNSYFQRAEAAKQAGIVCGISLPIYAGEFLQAVVVMFCAGGPEVVGAMEVWRNVNGNDNELKLADGYYGDLERFEWVSRRLTIMRGRGLPGGAWQQGRPIIIDDIGRSNTFLRARNAAELGITTGLAMPFSYSESEITILNFLSAKDTPIARRFEIWMVDPDEQCITFDSGQCSAGTDLAGHYADTRISKGHGPLGEAWLTGRPVVTDVEDPALGEAMVVLPVIDRGSLNSLVCMVM
jgi:hypothetical protein